MVKVKKTKKVVVPVLKWVGGKRQLLTELRKSIPSEYNTYFEPFVGGGALLFDLQPKKAIINDINAELINVYNVIKYNVDELIDELHKYKNEENFYYEVRDIDRNKRVYNKLTNVQKAARIIFLNKTCFNGLFRVNQSGEFNTPFGKYKNPNFTNTEALSSVNKYFVKNDISISSVDYIIALRKAKRGDFVYIDPPYDPVSNSSNFTGYTIGGFDRNEQVRLKVTCDMLNEKGVMFLLSNSSTDFINELYKEYNITTVKAKRSINSKGDKRGEIDEVLIRNYGEVQKD